jgi:hypothetical protein
MLVAMKVMVSGYLILLPLAARYALAAAGRGATRLSPLVFPFVANFLFEKGFYNFCYSVGFFLIVVGYYLRHREDFTPRRAAVLFLLTVPLYFAHPVSLGMAYVVVGAVAVTSVVRGRGPVRAALLWPLAALAPTALLLAWFVVRQKQPSANYLGLATLAELLVELHALYSFQPFEMRIAGAVAIVFGITTVALLVAKARARRWGPGDDLLAAVAAVLCVYFVTPNVAAGGSWISTRLTLYPYLLLVLWFGAQAMPGRAVVALQAFFAVAALALLYLHARAYQRLNPYLAEFASVAPHVARDSTLLPISLTDRGVDGAGRRLSRRIRVFHQASGYLAAERDLVDLSNYEATKAYFPLRFRPEVDPAKGLLQGGGADGAVATPRVAEYEAATGGRARVDYVLVWEVREGADPDRGPSEVERGLAETYELTFTSRNGFARLYRRRQ